MYEINGSSLADVTAVRGALSPRPKTLVILGSSNGAGLGASTYSGDPTEATGWSSPPTSWAGLLTSALQSADPSWKVYNRSKSGTGTSTSIGRFWTDVAPHLPSHIILCTHPSNNFYNPQSYLLGTIELINLCRSIGATPIVRGAYTSNEYTAATYRAMLDLNRQLDRLGVARIDHFSVLDDGTGHILSGYNTDHIHLNDAGQAAQYSCIDLGLFLNGITDGCKAENVPGAWKCTASTGTGIRVNSSTGMRGNIRSFTMRARVKGTTSQSKAFLCAYTNGAVGTNPLRVRNPSDVYEIADATNTTVGTLSSVNPTSDADPHDIVMTYNRVTNEAVLYIDGEPVTSGSPDGSLANSVSEFVFGGRGESGNVFPANGASFSDLAIWQAPLSADAVKDMYLTNRIPLGSLIFEADLSYRPPTSGSRGLVLNTVRNGIMPVIGEATWEHVAPF
jgi:hypothetical protein